MAVDRVDPKQDGDGNAVGRRNEAGIAILADEFGPTAGGGALVAERAAVAPGEDRAEWVADEVGGGDG